VLADLHLPAFLSSGILKDHRQNARSGLAFGLIGGGQKNY
jgi:hypothetical protein